MTLFNGVKRATRYVFVDMPLSVIGWRQLQANNGYIRDLWHSLRAPKCPECGRGIMHLPNDAKPDDKALYGWECTKPHG